MPLNAQVFTSIPDGLIQLLTMRLPPSLNILRRLQSASRAAPSGTERIVLVSDDTALQKSSSFTLLYADFSVSTGTQLTMYSTLEDRPVREFTSEERAEYGEQLRAMVCELILVRKRADPEGNYPTALLLGSLHAELRAILQKTGRVVPRPTGLYDKWLFRVEDLPSAESLLPEGMRWDHATSSDCEVVVSRTDIPRTAASLSRLANCLLRLEDDRPVAWAFLGLDGSLISVHCEDGYRRMGLAKKVASRLLQESARELAPDGWFCADVSPDNTASQALCRSLNGKPMSTVSWVLLELAEQVPA